MKVKELAKAFGMDVNTLSIISGYSRQGLYDVVENKKGIEVNKLRFGAFLEHLTFINNSIHEQDIAEARIGFNYRGKIIDELRQNVEGGAE